MAIKKPKDNSFKSIFDNHELFAQFLRRFIPLDILKNVKPGDIEDMNERHLPLFQENRDSDTIKRVKLKGKRFPLFVIIVLEHESKVNFRAPFKMLLYITLVLEHFEKEMEKKRPGIIFTKKFRYPPILPILFYDGPDSWTAARTMVEKTEFGALFNRYIPDFTYELVSLRDYSPQELAESPDPLSLIMLIDKIRDSGGGVLLKELPAKYFKELQIPKTMYKLLSDVTRVLLDGSGITKDQLDSIISRFDQREYKWMFEGIIEGYRKSYRKGYKQAKTRYLKQLQRRDEQFHEQLRQVEEENRRLKEQLAGKEEPGVQKRLVDTTPRPR
jgi:hypothetical protein